MASRRLFDGATREIGQLPIQGSNKLWIRISGVWQEAQPWIRVSGVWKQAQPWIKVDGVWRQG